MLLFLGVHCSLIRGFSVQLLFLQADPDVEKTAEAPESQVQTAAFQLSHGLKCCL